MAKLSATSGEFEYQWASDVDFDGIRLEVLTADRDVMFDVSVPEVGDMTVNTFGLEIPAELIATAVNAARKRRTDSGT
ncbi:hypothetical protein ACIQC9_02905 [Brevundimonas sp. NPDC092305]|uniref:hypothetical protein n=1 Tax=Brevundimonas sp. NPDC092305 TaxID=3363957 RepID=UPI003806F704